MRCLLTNVELIDCKNKLIIVFRLFVVGLLKFNGSFLFFIFLNDNSGLFSYAPAQYTTERVIQCLFVFVFSKKKV